MKFKPKYPNKVMKNPFNVGMWCGIMMGIGSVLLLFSNIPILGFALLMTSFSWYFYYNYTK